MDLRLAGADPVAAPMAPATLPMTPMPVRGVKAAA
jgi:hypothetical protein